MPPPLSKTKASFIAGFREQYDPQHIFRDGKGTRLFDETGREFLDFSSQYWNVNLGHKNPDMVQALHEALGKHLFISHRVGETDAQKELAQRLVDLFGGRFPGVQFMCSGSMAIESAIKITRQITGREHILSLQQSYHGMSYGALNTTGCDGIVTPFGKKDPRHHHLPPFRCSLCPYGRDISSCGIYCADEVVNFITEHGDKLAALIAEPVISNQVITPPKEFWPRVSKACRDNGVFLVADEIVSGMGRCGEWYGSDIAGMQPDFIALGKGMTSGFLPFAALLHPPAVAEHYMAGRLLHGQTFDGYDLGCRTVMALIDIIEKEELLSRVREKGQRLRVELSDLAQRQPAIQDVRGWGLLWGLEIAPRALPDQQVESFAAEMQRRLVERGVLLGGLGRVIIFAPPFIVGDEEIIHAVKVAEEILRETLATIT